MFATDKDLSNLSAYLDGFPASPQLRRLLWIPLRFRDLQDEDSFAKNKRRRLTPVLKATGVGLLICVLSAILLNIHPDSAAGVVLGLRWVGFVIFIISGLAAITIPSIVMSDLGGALLFCSLLVATFLQSAQRVYVLFGCGAMMSNCTDVAQPGSAGSEPAIVLCLALTQMMAATALPMRSSLLWFLLLLVPATYAGLTFPVLTTKLPPEGLGLNEEIFIVILLFAHGCLCLGSSIVNDTGHRAQWVKVRLAMQELTKEKVLRCQAEHQAEKGPFRAEAVARRQGNLSPGVAAGEDNPDSSSAMHPLEVKPRQEATKPVKEKDAVDHKPEEASAQQGAASHDEHASSTAQHSPTPTLPSDSVIASLGKLSSDAESSEHGSELKLRLQRIAEVGVEERWLISANQLKIFYNKMLGSGGFGTVVMGRLFGTDVAVKVPRKGALGVRSLSALANELRVMRHVRHPNIVSFHGAHVDPDSKGLALVMELVKGPRLDQLIARPPQDPSAEARRSILLGLCQAMRYLHNQHPPVIHGDLKPANVLMEEWGWCPKLADFGLSRALTRNAARLGGTITWMAPEVLLGTDNRPAASADIFSLGRLSFFVVTGKRPLSGLHKNQIIEMARNQELPPLKWPQKEVTFQAECKLLTDECQQFDPRNRPNIVVVHKDILKWGANPDAGGLDTLASSGEASTVGRSQVQVETGQTGLSPANDAFRMMQRSNEGEAVSDFAGALLAQPQWAVTSDKAKQLSLLDALLHWNIRVPASSCCVFHAYLHEAIATIRVLKQRNCERVVMWYNWQCPRCGLLEEPPEDGGVPECILCDVMTATRTSADGRASDFLRERMSPDTEKNRATGGRKPLERL